MQQQAPTFTRRGAGSAETPTIAAMDETARSGDENAERLPEIALDEIAAGAGLEHIRDLSAGCHGCDLWARATQTVFGEGPADARLVLVGEQPGDQEDRVGRPFVGPAGGILDRALRDAGIDREHVFVTNVVKHFKWRPSGKRRLHERPTRAEVKACGPWLEAELALVRPDAVALLGATAGKALLGPSFTLARHAGRAIDSDLASFVLATIHPSAVLRAPDEEARRAAYERLTSDLRLVAARLDGATRASERLRDEAPASRPRCR